MVNGGGSKSRSFRKSLILVLLIASNFVIGAKVRAVPTYTLEFEGPPGDFISQGQHVLLTEKDIGLSPVAADSTGDGLVDIVQFNSSGIGRLFFLLFFDTNKIPGNLVPGFYPDAQRSPFAQPGHPGLWLAWDHRGCNTIAGSYTISEAVFAPSGPQRFSAQFEQRCEVSGPPLHGTFQFAEVPEPPILFLLVALLAGLFTPRARGRRQAAKTTLCFPPRSSQCLGT